MVANATNNLANGVGIGWGVLSMNKEVIITVVLVVLVAVVLFQTFQIVGMKGTNAQAASVTQTSSGSGESYEEMMARMHPDQVKSTQRSSAQSINDLPSMVGGC